MKLNFDTPAEEVRIEIVPLIDVIFCILTFFILAAVSLTRQSAIGVDLPSAATGTAQMREMLIVSVDPIGQTYVEQEPVTRDRLYQILLEYEQTNPAGILVLYASRSASYNDVVEVLDLLRTVGGDRVALATLPEGATAGQGDLPGLDPNFNAPGAPLDPYSLPGSNAPFDPNQELFPGLDSVPSQPGNSSIPIQPQPGTDSSLNLEGQPPVSKPQIEE